MENKQQMELQIGEQPDWAGDEEVTSVDSKQFFEELISEDLATSMTTRGYAVIRLPEDIMDVYDKFGQALAAFCHQPIEEKAKFATKQLDPNLPFSPNQFHGYSKLSGLKEQYMIRGCGKKTKLLFPGTYPMKDQKNNEIQSPHFGKTSLALYEMLDRICRDTLHKVCDKLNFPHSNADRLLDEVNQFSQDYETSVHTEKDTEGFVCNTSYFHDQFISSSILDVFHYSNSFNREDGSFDKFYNNHAAHTDSGILTVVPCADVAGLEVLDQKRKIWIALEQIIHQEADNHRKYATIFWGDSYEYLTKSSAKPCLHRVAKSEKPRYSIVFKMRTKPLTTAPRYQEDYVITYIQHKSIQSVYNRSLRNFAALGTTALGVALIALQSLIVK